LTKPCRAQRLGLHATNPDKEQEKRKYSFHNDEVYFTSVIAALNGSPASDRLPVI
jgi:hypothetical protein